jgi:hypothetical protein
MINGENFKYSLLTEGDIIEQGDEYYNPMLDEWLPVSDGLKDDDGFYPDAIIGYEFSYDEHKPIRRKN